MSNKLDQKIKSLIDTKASTINHKAFYHAQFASTIINQLNDFIDGKLILSEERIVALLDHLVGHYTITLDIPLSIDTKILRAVKFDRLDNKPCFDKVSRLSYIPYNSGIVAPRGRLNKGGDAIYYGCIYFNDDYGGFNIAFSEINALKNEKINILTSITTSEVNVNYIGIYDYIRKEIKPSFLSEDTYAYFKSVYEYSEKKLDQYIFTAFQLSDAFFSDILRRKESERLYIITSILASLFLDGNSADGIIYTSVKAEGSPVIALKPISVDKKLSHKEAFSFEIQENFGYAIYKADLLYKGSILRDEIKWN